MILFSKILRGAAIMVVMCITCSQTSGQSVWLDPTVKQGVAIEILQPHMDAYEHNWYSDSVSLESSVWFVSGQIRLMENIRLLMEVPISHYKAARFVSYYDGDWYERVGDIGGYTMIGNPSISLEHAGPGVSFYQQIGARLALVRTPDDVEAAYGVLADVNRLDAFAENGYSFRARLGLRISRSNGLLCHLFVEPLYMHYTQRVYYLDYEYGFGREDSQTVSDGFLTYGGQVWLTTPIARMGVGFIGRFWMDNKGTGFRNNSIHQFGCTASFGSGSVRPAFHFRVPLDRDLAMVRFVYGLNLIVGLGGDS